MADGWADGNAYEGFMGRWSRLVAPRFLTWLHLPTGLRWVDLGCGTGALTSAVLATAVPARVLALDPSSALLDVARERTDDSRVEFCVGTAADLTRDVADVVVSGLVLNFLPDAGAAVAAMAAAAPHGTVAAYVWDYAGRMQLLRTFWDVACALDVRAIDQDEAQRFPLCEPEALADLWRRAGMTEVSTVGLAVTTEFTDLEDLWKPFLYATGPAPSYVATLDAAARDRLREAFGRMVHPDRDGHIRMQARAWAVRGRVA